MTLQRSNGNDENDGNDDGDDDSSEIIDSGVARWKPHLFFAKGSCRGSSQNTSSMDTKAQNPADTANGCSIVVAVVVVRIVLFPTTKKMSIATKSIDSGVALSNGFLRRVNSEHESAQPRKPSEWLLWKAETARSGARSKETALGTASSVG